MKKLLLILSVILTILTFAGAIYVLTSNGTANAGYAAVPLLFDIVCIGGSKANKNKQQMLYKIIIKKERGK